MLKHGLSAFAMGALIAASSPALAQQATTEPGMQQQDQQTQAQAQAQTRQLPQGASEVVNKQVFGSTGEEIGQVRDVIINQDGSVEAVVIERGGVLGIGAQQVAVDWNQLSLDPQREGLSINMTDEQVSQLPEYQEGGQVVEEPPAAQPGEQQQQQQQQPQE